VVTGVVVLGGCVVIRLPEARSAYHVQVRALAVHLTCLRILRTPIAHKRI